MEQSDDDDDADEEMHEEHDDATGPGQQTKIGQDRHRPGTQKEMGKLRESFPNTVAVCAHLYKDLSLRDDLRMVATATRFFMTEYSDVLSVLKMSQDLQGVSNAGIVKLNRKTNNIDKMFQGMSYVSII